MGTDMPCAIEIEQVGVHFYTRQGETAVLHNVSLCIETGQFVAIVGPSGCGKSTLLSCIMGMTTVQRGQIRVMGQPVSGIPPQVGYMLQQDSLMGWLSVLDNVLVGARVRGISGIEVKTKALDLLKRYGLAEFAHVPPRQLSGGMRQRVALARTMLLDPEILLLDEPFSALDYQTRLAIGDEIATILREPPAKTVMLVTHDISEAIALADRVVVLSKRPATVKADHVIQFDGPRPGTLSVRTTLEHARWFDRIWGELDVHVHRAE